MIDRFRDLWEQNFQALDSLLRDLSPEDTRKTPRKKRKGTTS